MKELTQNEIEAIKAELNNEIRTLYLETDDSFLNHRFNWIYKIFKLTKEKALKDVMKNSFLDKKCDTVDYLVMTYSNVSVLIESKYKIIRFGNFLAPIWKFVFPFVLSFVAILLTINSISDLKLIKFKRLAGIDTKTIVLVIVVLIAAAIIFSMFVIKKRYNRMFAVYIRERLDYIIQCKMLEEKMKETK